MKLDGNSGRGGADILFSYTHVFFFQMSLQVFYSDTSWLFITSTPAIRYTPAIHSLPTAGCRYCRGWLGGGVGFLNPTKTQVSKNTV